jgi:streptomycin 6-kinase
MIEGRTSHVSTTEPEHAEWLARLPATIRDLERRWSLTLGAPFESQVTGSWVAPVTVGGGTAAVLKIGRPHMEAEHEIDGLRFWDGDATVRLLDADASAGALLLERCEPGTPLSVEAESMQDVVVARLLRRLWRSPSSPHPFRPLSAMASYWMNETVAHEERWSDSGLVREGLRIFRELSQSGPEQVLLATDLHAGNVLRARREPWLAIDPKPFVGDPAYDATQHLLNCRGRLRADPVATIGRFADLVGVDRRRVRLWTFARAAAEPREDWNDEALTEIARALAP